MKVIDFIKCLGCWDRIQILLWDIEDDDDENRIMFKGYAEDCPYKCLKKDLVNPKVMEPYGKTPLSMCYQEKDAILTIWITENDKLKDETEKLKNLKKF